MAIMVKIVAAGMLDTAALGHDVLWVEEEDGAIKGYEVNTDGKVAPLQLALARRAVLDSHMFRFQMAYPLATPVDVDGPEELSKFLGRFRLDADGTCRLKQ
jgi:hypothetical protein